MKANMYFKKVHKSSSFMQKRSLDNIKVICDELEKRSLRIRIMVVGRECMKRFAMTSGNTIKSNLVLKEYIRLRAAGQEITLSSISIDDINMRERLVYLELENKKLREILKNISLN